MVSAEGDALFDRLYRQSSMREKELARRKAQLEKESGLTFRPQLSRRSQVVAQSQADCGEEPVNVYDRLHRAGLSLKQQREAMSEHAEDDELRECTFQPSLSTASRKLSGVTVAEEEGNVFSRLARQSAKEVELLREEIKKQQELEGCTFQPNLSRRAPRGSVASHDAADGDEAPIWERLARGKRPQPAPAPQMTEEEMAECTFHPKTLGGARRGSHVLTGGMGKARRGSAPPTAARPQAAPQQEAGSVEGNGPHGAGTAQAVPAPAGPGKAGAKRPVRRGSAEVKPAEVEAAVSAEAARPAAGGFLDRMRRQNGGDQATEAANAADAGAADAPADVPADAQADAPAEAPVAEGEEADDREQQPEAEGGASDSQESQDEGVGVGSEDVEFSGVGEAEPQTEGGAADAAGESQ